MILSFGNWRENMWMAFCALGTQSWIPRHDIQPQFKVVSMAQQRSPIFTPKTFSLTFMFFRHLCWMQPKVEVSDLGCLLADIHRPVLLHLDVGSVQAKRWYLDGRKWSTPGSWRKTPNSMTHSVDKMMWMWHLKLCLTKSINEKHCYQNRKHKTQAEKDKQKQKTCVRFCNERIQNLNFKAGDSACVILSNPFLCSSSLHSRRFAANSAKFGLPPIPWYTAP